jgi:hypothetical protein
MRRIVANSYADCSALAGPPSEQWRSGRARRRRQGAGFPGRVARPERFALRTLSAARTSAWRTSGPVGPAPSVTPESAAISSARICSGIRKIAGAAATSAARGRPATWARVAAATSETIRRRGSDFRTAGFPMLKQGAHSAKPLQGLRTKRTQRSSETGGQIRPRLRPAGW